MRMNFFSSDRQVNEDAVLADDYVITRIWLAKLNDETRTAKEIVKVMSFKPDQIAKGSVTRLGHVSLETKNKYISWYPGEALNGGGIGSLLKVFKSKNNTLVLDKFMEGSVVGESRINAELAKPDLTVCLYSLNVANMEQQIDNIRLLEDENLVIPVGVHQSKTGYVLVGDKPLVRAYNGLFNESKKGENCSSMAYRILWSGGIGNLTSFYKDLTLKYIWVTPDNLASFVKHAKEAECTLYPKTKAFSVQDSVLQGHLANAYIPTTLGSLNSLPSNN